MSGGARDPLTLVFAPPSPSQATYALLSLPPTLLSLLSNPTTSSSLEIRGHTTDAAVLVSPTQTFSLRGVQNSNSLCLCSGGTGERFGEGGRGVGELVGEDGEGGKAERVIGTIEIQATLHETLEVVPAVARTDRLAGLLKASEYTGEDEESSRSSSVMHTFDSLRSLLPASDAEIRLALKTLRVLPLSSFLRPLPPSYLLTLLPPLLSSLTSSSEPDSTPLPPKKSKGKERAAVVQVEKKEEVLLVEMEELLATLDAADCCEEVARGVLEWFGREGGDAGKWELRMGDVVREVGIGVLADGGFVPQKLDKFLARWKELCGSFAPLCSLPLLSGQHLLTPPNTITFFPLSHLSPDPTTRFTELFAIRPRWNADEMVKFVDDLVGGERKKREAMVLKFVRKVKEGERVVWTARNLW